MNSCVSSFSVLQPLLCDAHGKLEDVQPDATHLVTCPYCGEEIEIYVELDVRGSYVQDCEVCCNPWNVRVSRDGEDLYVEVGKADGSE